MTDMSQADAFEPLIMRAFQPVVRELRMVNIEDYVAYFHFEKHHQIADIIDSATEQFFAPGFVSYRESGTLDISWNKPGSVGIDLSLNTPKAVFEFSLTLSDLSAAVVMGDVKPIGDKESSLSYEDLLIRALETNRISVEP